MKKAEIIERAKRDIFRNAYNKSGKSIIELLDEAGFNGKEYYEMIMKYKN